MTPEMFSSLAARVGDGVQVRSVFDTARVCLAGRAFATLGWPGAGWAVLKLDPREQDWALGLSDGVRREPGTRRRAGVILLRLERVEPGIAEAILKAAWRYAARRAAPMKQRAPPPSLDYVGRAAA